MQHLWFQHSLLIAAVRWILGGGTKERKRGLKKCAGWESLEIITEHNLAYFCLLLGLTLSYATAQCH